MNPTWKGSMVAGRRLSSRGRETESGKQEAERASWKYSVAMIFQSVPSGILPSARLCLLTIPKQCHQLGTKYSNA